MNETVSSRSSQLDKVVLEFIASACLVVYCYFIFLNRMTEMIDFSSPISHLVISATGCYLLVYNSVFLRTPLISKLLIFLFTLSGVLTIIRYADPTKGQYLVMLLGNVGVALQILRNRNNWKLFYPLLFGIAIFYLIQMIMGVNPKLIHNMMSKNHISVNVLFATSFAAIIVNINKENKKANVFLVIVNVVISIWTQSRGAMIASAAMIILIVARYFNSIKSKVLKVLILVTGMYLIVDIATMIDYEQVFSVFYRKSFVYDPRFELMSFYFKDFDFTSLFWGVDLDIALEYSILKNLHNSYLVIHSRMGIWGLIYLFLIGISIYKCFRSHDVIYIFAIGVLLRAFSDTILMSYFDYILIFLLLKYLRFYSPNECYRLEQNE